MKYSITYEVSTPESCEHGDSAANGWYLPSGWHFPLQDEDGHHPEILAESQAGGYEITGTLSECLSDIRDLGLMAIETATGAWFDGHPVETDIAKCETTRYHLHIDCPRNAARVARFLNQ